MQPILVAYGTTEGQTRKIAEFIAERLRIRGHRVDLVDTATPAAQQLGASYQAAIVGGSLHQQRHQRSLEHFLKDNRVWLDAMPLALFSVSLAAALDDMDDRLDALHKEFIQSIFESHHGTTLDLQPAVQLALVGRYYERVGDHAVNIGHRVQYMVTGDPNHLAAEVR